jgi:membrane protease YdiL (CAAX protease family)
MGDVNAHISKIAWLGVTGNETWLEIATSMGFFITLATGIFVFFQLKKAGVDYRYFLFSLLWSIPFSMANAFSEEAIFRVGIVSPLYGIFSVSVIVLISAAVFGLPHYFGMPSGIIGVLMAGFLGWLLALSLVETQGLFLAWAIHCQRGDFSFGQSQLPDYGTDPLYDGCERWSQSGAEVKSTHDYPHPL